MSDGPQWTFFTNHAHVLICLARRPRQALREVAAKVGITERAVQRMVADLEAAGYLRRQRTGRRNTYALRTDLPLRHPLEAHRTIGNLLEVLVPDAAGVDRVREPDETEADFPASDPWRVGEHGSEV